MGNGGNIGFIRSLVNGDLEGFRRRFESFLDQCPSFLHYVGVGRFSPVFFLSMFATAHDAGILYPNEEIYFRFDNHGVDPRNGENRNTGNLKVAVLTNEFLGEKRIVRCYSICDVYNSQGARFSEREGSSIEDQIFDQNPGLEGNLHFEQYKVCMHGKSKSQGEAIATAFDVIRESEFGKYSSSEIDFLRQEILENDELTVKEIEAIQLNRNQREQLDGLVNFVQMVPGQQRIDDFIGMLASNRELDVRDRVYEEILPYITRIYRNYRQALENDIEDRNQKFEGHGFFLGFLANLSHLCTMDIDLDLSPENSHVAFLVRRQAERENVPIVVNLATGRTWSRTSLDRAIDHAKRLHVSSFIPIHTESRNTVCVGLNFNLNQIPFRVDIVGLQQDRFPLVQRLFEYLENEEIRENIRDFLLYHLPGEIPRNAENYNRVFNYITGFAFGSSVFDIYPLQTEEEDEVHVTKYIFRYDDEDLRRHALTMVFHAQGSDIVMLHIRDHGAQQQGAINLQTLDIGRNNPRIWEISCTLNNQLELDIDLPNELGLYHNYQNNNANNFLDGDLVQVPNAKNVHNALNQVMNDGWQNIDQHRALLMAISRVLMPENMNGDTIIDVDSEDKFRSMLHGASYVSDGPDKVFTGYTIGQTYSSDIRIEEVRTRVTKQRLGLLLLRQPIENDPDTHPIGYVLRFANDVEEVEQEQIKAEQQITELIDKQRGYMNITRRNEVVLSYAIFNRDAQRAEDLILFPGRLYVHKLDRRGRQARSPVEPNDILPQINRHIHDNIGIDPINNVHDILTLDFATDNRYYHYWLQDRDIRSTARTQLYNLQPDPNDNILFTTQPIEWIGDHFRRLQQYVNGREMQNNEILISNMIVNIGGNHWVILTIAYQNGNYYGYYANSSGGNVPDQINNLRVNNVPIPVHNVLADQQGNALVQQRDGYNCGIWVLENARDINQVLRQNNNLGEQGRGVLDEMRNSLTLNVPGLDNQANLRNEQYFQERRREISRGFRNINNNGIHQFPQQEHLLDRNVIIGCQNLNGIRQLLLNFLELLYPTRRVEEQPRLGGVPISLNFGNPQSTLEGLEASSVSDHNKSKGGR